MLVTTWSLGCRYLKKTLLPPHEPQQRRGGGGAGPSPFCQGTFSFPPTRPSREVQLPYVTCFKEEQGSLKKELQCRKRKLQLHNNQDFPREKREKYLKSQSNANFLLLPSIIQLLSGLYSSSMPPCNLLSENPFFSHQDGVYLPGSLSFPYLVPQLMSYVCRAHQVNQ